ncbi:unnamed protein product [Gongylonema pulchrum]|uniref:Protein kinase domain-containing protein n=1 Tax=Gongylonema pulchrum TaxID=637853 RepID=A0A183E7V4_9BILA|nr:unnamed protein product [Gongylonema pulchrum]
MLRFSGACRANIDEIANHCWLNYDKNMPAIQDLPENKVHFHFKRIFAKAICFKLAHGFHTYKAEQVLLVKCFVSHN